MAGKREERKKARFQWLAISWLIVAAIIVAGVGGIILFMDRLYQQENHRGGAQLPQQLENRDGSSKWAQAYTIEWQSSNEWQSDDVLTERESQQGSESQKSSETQLDSDEVQASTDNNNMTEKRNTEESIAEGTEICTEEESSMQETSDTKVADADSISVSNLEPARSIAIGDVKSDTPTYVSLVAVGDNLMHYDVSMSGLQADGSFNYDYNFAYVKDIVQAADLAVINQECVIGGDQWGIRDYPCFNVRTEVAAAIANAGFDVVLAATNHVLDIGKVGSLYMVDFFRTNYPQLTLLGIHDSWEKRDEIHVIEKNGIRIGMINYTDILNCQGDYNADGQYLVDMLDYDRLATLIQRTKAASDFVIVFPHWGTEYNLGISDSQKEQAAFLAAQGVDLVIGTHPHVVEPIDYIDRPDGGKMLIYYSLGNFQSLQRKEATLLGGMAKVTIKKDFKGARIIDFDMETLVTDYRLGGVRVTDYFDIITTYPWSKYSRAIAESSNIGNGNANFNLDYMFQLQAEQAAQVHEARHKAGLE